MTRKEDEEEIVAVLKQDKNLGNFMVECSTGKPSVSHLTPAQVYQSLCNVEKVKGIPSCFM